MPLSNYSNYGNFFTGLSQGIESGSKLPLAYMSIKGAQADRELAQQRIGLEKQRFGLDQQKAEREKQVWDVENRTIGVSDALKAADAYGMQTGDVNGASQLKTELQAVASPDGKIRYKDWMGIKASHADLLKSTAPEKASGIGVYNRFTNKVLIPEVKQPTGGIEGLRLESFTKEAGGDPVKGRQLYDEARRREIEAGEKASMARTLAAQKEPAEKNQWRVEYKEETISDGFGGFKTVKRPAFKINQITGEEKPLTSNEAEQVTRRDIEDNRQAMAFATLDSKNPQKAQEAWTKEPEETKNAVRRANPALAAKYDNVQEKSKEKPKEKTVIESQPRERPQQATPSQPLNEPPMNQVEITAKVERLRNEYEVLKKELQDKSEMGGGFFGNMQPKAGISKLDWAGISERANRTLTDLQKAENELDRFNRQQKLRR